MLNLSLNYIIENAVELCCSLKEKIVIFFKLCSYRNLDAEDPPDPQLMRLDNMLIGSDFYNLSKFTDNILIAEGVTGPDKSQSPSGIQVSYPIIFCHLRFLIF